MTDDPIESSHLLTLCSRRNAPDGAPAARKSMWLFLVSLGFLVLTACGADVNSQLEFEEDFSGTRTFVMTMAESDAEALSGGIEAAASALEKHTPEVLSFEGVDQREEGYSASFIMAFEDLEDYQDKISVLLDASDVPAAEQDMTIETDVQPLVTTLSFEESFYNDDLMGWAAEALISERVVESDATVLTSSGAATVLFDGEEVTTSTSLPRMNFTLTDDRRFQDVGLDVEFLESGDFRVTLDYFLSPDSATAQHEFLTDQVVRLNEVEGLTEPVADSGSQDSSESRRISAQFSTPQALSAGIQLFLANEEAAFKVEESSAPDSPDVISRYIGTDWTCEAICEPNNLQQLDGETTYPDHWKIIEERREDGEFFIEFNRGMPLQEMTAATRLNFDGSMEQTFEFVVDNATQQGHEDTVTDRFSPPPNTGSFHSGVQGEKTVYTVTFQAENAHALSTMINTYLQDKGIEPEATVEHEPLVGIWAMYDLRVDVSPVWEVATGGVKEATTFSVELPTMHSGNTDTADSHNGVIIVEDSTGTFIVQANGPTITTIWVAVLTILFLIVIIVLLYRTRRAATTVWDVASATREDVKPYNVQGPNDRLTETEILEAPLATRDETEPTMRTPSGGVTTKALDATDPFPDLPVPTHTQYHRLQDRLRKKREDAESTEHGSGTADVEDRTKPDDSSDDQSTE